jgi:hypothetical protein
MVKWKEGGGGVHHRTHNSPPPVPVLSQSNPIHTPQANVHKIYSEK